MTRKEQNRILTPELLARVRAERNSVAGLGRRTVRCPACRHTVLFVYDDAKGHVQAKCSRCGWETIFDLALRREREQTIA